MLLSGHHARNRFTSRMTLAPRFLVKLIASYRMRQLQKRLRWAEAGPAHQRRIFGTLMSAHAQTEFGRLHGLGPRTTYPEYRTQVPLRTPVEFSGWIERMAAGAADVLWPGHCRFFVYTAGTVDGTPKPLPATPAMLAHYR
ncbi:MAG TPA: GH3 auxin-responsive promoter family protein, partial [Acidobacteriota bacterium]|nr:GH3 auxin-responsive promoter family protein [Acidobacteriota bacterium]